MSRPKQKKRPKRQEQRIRSKRRSTRNGYRPEPCGRLSCGCDDLYPPEPLPPKTPSEDTVRSSSVRATWVPQDGRIFVQGRWISGGMVYVGSYAESANGHWTEPSLVDPDLPVDWKRADWDGETIDDWPSYVHLDPRARAAYLGWLAGGRKDEYVHTGYVELFLYGLERRLLLDIGTDTDHPDMQPLINELFRLIEIYNYDQRFFEYATKLLEFIETLFCLETEYEPIPRVPDQKASQVPIAVRIGIGKYLAGGANIPAEWALSYLHHNSGHRLRTPAHRCPDEFDELFTIRYRERFPDGMKVRRPASRVDLSYTAVSPGFSQIIYFPGWEPAPELAFGPGLTRGANAGTASVASFNIPDITWTDQWSHSPIDKLRKLAGQCTDELEAYSRFVGKHSDRAQTAAAISLLPDALLDSHGGPLLNELRGWMEKALAGRSTRVVALADMVQKWSPGHPGKLTGGEAKSLSAWLGKLGVGIEPDVRFGSPPPKPNSSAVLFSLPDGADDVPSSAYQAARPLLHLAAVVVGADGTIDRNQRRSAVDHIADLHDLNLAERRRAGAHLEFLATGRLGMYGMKGKVEDIPTEDRAGVGGFLVELATVGGAASPKQVTALEKVFGYLGLEDGEVYRRLHRLDLNDPGPVAVRKPRDTSRRSIPDPDAPAEQASSVSLDYGKVQIRLAETDRVSALLSDIFVEETPAELVTALPEPETEATIEGLDGPHRRLLFTLTSRSEWGRRSAEEMAESFGLPFLEGALDVINEVSMDTCGEPVVEGFDPVVLNKYAVKELC